MKPSFSKTKFITNTNELVYNNECLISGHSLNDDYLSNNNVIRLRCGHSYNYNFFIKCLNQMNKKFEGLYKCPYCMNNIEKVPCHITKKMLHNTIYNMIYTKNLKKKSPFITL